MILKKCPSVILFTCKQRCSTIAPLRAMSITQWGTTVDTEKDVTALYGNPQNVEVLAQFFWPVQAYSYAFVCCKILIGSYGTFTAYGSQFVFANRGWSAGGNGSSIYEATSFSASTVNGSPWSGYTMAQ
jgi:hypothetical protein